MATHAALGLVAAVGAAACAHRFEPAGPAELRLSTNPDVRWELGGRRELAVLLENVGRSPTAIAEPSPAHVRVAVFEPTGAAPVCRKEPGPVRGGGEAVDLAAREVRALVVELESCELAPGEYRYEAWYEAPAARNARWSGRLGPERGRIVVQRPGEIVETPAARGAVSPPEHAEAPGAAAAANPHFRPAVPPLGAASLACTDRELARRGLNAWGDPAGTPYPEGPPTLSSDVERQRMVLERYPDIATLCRVPP